MTFREQVMSKKELAAYAGVSTKSVDRGLGDCLQPFKFGGKVFYNRAQVERHFESLIKNRGRCDGNCASDAVAVIEPGSRLRRKR
jgi:hypothetical protein